MNPKFIRYFSPCVAQLEQAQQTLILKLVLQQPWPLSASYFYKLHLLFPFVFPGALSFLPALFASLRVLLIILFVFSGEIVLQSFWPRVLVSFVRLLPLWRLSQLYPGFL
jgi:hypothetical protein